VRRTPWRIRAAGTIFGIQLLAGAAGPIHAQAAASEGTSFDVSGVATVTSKGISLVPAFTLGRPAAIFDLAVRRGKVGFEPQFRFALDGKPWSFLLRWRYRPDTGERFRLTLGVYPAFSFKEVSDTTDAGEQEIIQVSRYLTGELAPSYALTGRVSLGAYYLYGKGLDETSAQHTHFVAARAGVTNLPIADGVSLQLAPQFYYLWTDDQDGVYFSSVATLTIRDLPIAIAASINQPIRTNVGGGKDFLWNSSLVYAW
jgi:hypothetical protein